MNKTVNSSLLENQSGLNKSQEIIDLTSDRKVTIDKINGILAQKNLLSTAADMVGKSASIASVILAGDAIKADGTGLGWDAPVAPYLNALLSNAIGLAVGGFSGAAVTVATGGNLVVGGIAGGAAGVASATLVSEAFKASSLNSWIGDVTFRELGNGLVDIGRDIDNLAKEISDQLHNSLDALGKELSHGAEQLATGLADSANELGQAIAETASEVLNDIKKAIEETKSQIENAVKAITDTVTDIFEGVKDLAKDLFDNSGIKELADEYLPDLIKDWLGLNREGQHYFYDPLVLDLDGDGIETIAHNKTNGAFFDNDADGLKVATGWVKSDDGLLVFDRNGDGIINDGTEVFGDNTQLENGEKALHGFEALADLDSNKDAKVDANDELFNQLKIWRDLNHDGISQENELFNLKDLGIKSLNLEYQDTNKTLNGNNLLTQIGSYEKEDGSIHKMGDVNFSFDSLYRDFSSKISVSEAVKLLPNIKGSGRLRDLHEAMEQSEVLKNLVKTFVELNTIQDQKELLPQLLKAWAKTDPNYKEYEDEALMSSVNYNKQGVGIAGSGTSTVSFYMVDEKVRNDFNYAKTKVGVIDSFLGTKTEKLFYVREADIIQMTNVINKMYDDISSSIFNILYEFSDAYNQVMDHLELTFDIDANDNLVVGLDFNKVNEYLIQRIKDSPLDAFIEITKVKNVVEEKYSNLVKVNFGKTLSLYYETMENLSNSDLVEVKSFIGNGFDLNQFYRGTQGDDELIGKNTSDTLLGGTGNDKLYGKEGTDTLIGGTGNDYLEGGYHGDTYIFAKGHGHDVIYDYSAGTGGADSIQFTDVKLEEAKFRKEGNNFIIYSGEEGDSVTIKDFFSSSYYEIENFVFVDKTFKSTELNSLDLQYSGTVNNDSLNGNSSSNIFYGSAGNDIYTSGKGADTIIYDLLDASVELNDGGNGVDTWNDFNISEGDHIDISKLLVDWDQTSEISDFIRIEKTGMDIKLNIDRDGHADNYSETQLMVLKNQPNINELDDLLKNNTIIY